MTRSAWSRFWFPAVPAGRLHVLRVIAYSFIFVDVLVTTAWVAGHADVPTTFYQPLFIGRVLPLPVPTHTVVRVVQVALLASAGVAVTGRAPRLAGAAVFALYLEWMVIAFSYGKVDHDRFAFLVALAVLPTVGALRSTDRTPDDRVGWALRCIQVAVVATYFLAVVAKFRIGGLAWLDSTTFVRAVVRRGTWLADPLLDHPGMLRAGQWSLVGFELASPLLLAPGRTGRLFVAAAFAFHLITYATITIIFLPHVVCLLAFTPLERVPELLQPALRRPALRRVLGEGGPGGRAPAAAASPRSPG